MTKHAREEGRRFEFRLVGGLWRMTSPFQDLADQGLLDNLESQLLATQRRWIGTRGASTPAQLEEWGLATPRGTVSVGAGERRVDIDVGGEGPVFDTGNGEVLQTIQVAIGDEVYQVSKGFDSILEANRKDLRGKFVFDTGYEGLKAVRLHRFGDEAAGVADVVVAAEMDRRGAWRLTEPWRIEANHSVLLPQLAAIVTTRALGFQPIESRPQYQQPETRPWIEVEVVGDFGKEVARLFKEADGQLYAFKANRPSLLQLDPKSFESLSVFDPGTLISHALWTWSPALARTVQLEVPKRSDPRGEGIRLSLQSLRPEPGFRLTLPQVLPADPGAHNRLFAALERISVLGLAEGADGMEAERVLAQPDLVVTLEPHPGERGGGYAVRLARGTGGRTFAQRGEASLRFVVDVPDWDAILQPWWHYVEPQAFTLASSRPVVTLRFEAGEVVRVATLRDGRWSLDGEVSEDAEAVLLALRRLVGREVVGPQATVGPALELQALGRITALSTAPDVEPSRVAGRLELWRDKDGEVVVANGDDGLLYRLRGPEGRLLARPFGP
ncbi:MAG: hypothetical protein R3F30_04980 [Planctomycetota bacterium]